MTKITAEDMFQFHSAIIDAGVKEMDIRFMEPKLRRHMATSSSITLTYKADSLLWQSLDGDYLAGREYTITVDAEGVKTTIGEYNRYSYSSEVDRRVRPLLFVTPLHGAGRERI